MNGPETLDYASPEPVAYEDLPGFRRIGAWKSVRVIVYAIALAGAVLFACVGWK